MGKIHHLQIKTGEIGDFVLLPEDPNRCENIAGQFQNPRLIAKNREYTTYTGKYKGLKVSVTSTGMGSPSAAIALEEIIKSGAKYCIRLGTSQKMQNYIKPGELIIPTAAVRQDGTSLEYAPIEFPAIADNTIVHALIAISRQKGLKSYEGIIMSNDTFYSDLSRLYLDSRKREKCWTDANVLSKDNESSALFTISYIRNIHLGSLLTATENLLNHKKVVTDKDEKRYYHLMTEICLEAFSKLNNSEKY